jgi:histidine triad (HIT) family protein
MTCPFCRIATGSLDAVVLYEDMDVVAFLDISPVRPGHTQVIPRAHVETFEQLAPALAARIVAVGQALARKMKAVYGVERVAFLFTGGDVPHAHAHVIPMHENTDVTSMRYIHEPQKVRLSAEHLLVERERLEAVRQELAFAASEVR